MAGVRQRVDFLAFADAQGGSTKQKKWDVGPQAGGDVQKPGCFELLTRELQVAEERRRRVAGATAQSASSRDFLLESDFDARANAAFAAQGVHGAVDEVLLHLFFSERFVALDLQGNAGMAGGAELQGVMQPDGLKNGAQLMLAVVALSQHFQTQVDPGVLLTSHCWPYRTPLFASPERPFRSCPHL